MPFLSTFGTDHRLTFQRDGNEVKEFGLRINFLRQEHNYLGDLMLSIKKIWQH